MIIIVGCLMMTSFCCLEKFYGPIMSLYLFVRVYELMILPLDVQVPVQHMDVLAVVHPNDACVLMAVVVGARGEHVVD